MDISPLQVNPLRSKNYRKPVLIIFISIENDVLKITAIHISNIRVFVEAHRSNTMLPI